MWPTVPIVVQNICKVYFRKVELRIAIPTSHLNLFRFITFGKNNFALGIHQNKVSTTGLQLV